MIIKEKYNDILTLTYSDQNVMIHKIGTDETYESAIDLTSLNVEYEETDIPIGQIESNEPIEPEV